MKLHLCKTSLQISLATESDLEILPLVFRVKILNIHIAFSQLTDKL